MRATFERPLMPDSDVSTLSAFVPVLILGLVLAAWFSFQATQLRAERERCAT